MFSWLAKNIELQSYCTKLAFWHAIQKRLTGHICDDCICPVERYNVFIFTRSDLINDAKSLEFDDKNCLEPWSVYLYLFAGTVLSSFSETCCVSDWVCWCQPCWTGRNADSQQTDVSLDTHTSFFMFLLWLTYKYVEAL